MGLGGTGMGPGALLGRGAGQVPLLIPRHVAPNRVVLVIPFPYSLSPSVPPAARFDFGEGAVPVRCPGTHSLFPAVQFWYRKIEKILLTVLVLSKLLEWCVGLYFPILLIEQWGQTWSGEVLGRFADGGCGASQCRAVPCHAMPCHAAWAGTGLASSAEPAQCGGAPLVWVAEQEEKMEMSLSERKRRLRSFGECGAVFRGPAGQGCPPASPHLPYLLWQTPVPSRSFHPTSLERCSERVCPQPTWPSSGYRPGTMHQQ